MKQDYCDWLTPERLAHEDEEWLTLHTELRQEIGNEVLRMCQRFGLRSVFEVGCGTAWLSNLLPEEIVYQGMDGNYGCVNLAVERAVVSEEAAKTRSVFWGNVREFTIPARYDLACSFSVLKHFGLHEWEAIFAKVLACGNFACFTMQLAPEDTDDGEEYPHTWLTRGRIERAIAACGQNVVRERVMWEGPDGKSDVMFFTAPFNTQESLVRSTYGTEGM